MYKVSTHPKSVVPAKEMRQQREVNRPKRDRHILTHGRAGLWRDRWTECGRTGTEGTCLSLSPQRVFAHISTYICIWSAYAYPVPGMSLLLEMGDEEPSKKH